MATLSIPQSVNALQSPSFPFEFEQDGFRFRVEVATSRYVEVIRIDTNTSYQACKTQASITAAMDALASECPFCRVELIPLAPQKLYSSVHGWHMRMWADCPVCGTTRIMGPRIPMAEKVVA